MRSSRIPSFFAFIFIAVSSVPAALAADPQPASVTAKALYDEGVDLTAQKNFKEAEARFLKAWALQRTYDIAANLGEVQMQLEKPADAAVFLTFALKNYPASGKAEKREWIANRLAEAKSKVGSVTVSVNVDHAEVRINGKPAGKSPLGDEVFVLPGDCTIEVAAAGYEPSVQKIKVVAGKAQKVQADLTPVRSNLLIPAIVGAGVGVVAIGVGVGLYMVSTDAYEQARGIHTEITGAGGSCRFGMEHPRCGALRKAVDQSDSLYAPGVALMIGGAAAAVIGGAYIGYSLRSSAPAKQGAGPRVTAVGVRGGGLFVQGSF